MPASLEDQVNASFLRIRGWGLTGFHELCETEYRIEGGAHFMTHALEEIRFGKVRLVAKRGNLVRLELRGAMGGSVGHD